MSNLSSTIFVVRKINITADNFDGQHTVFENMRAFEDEFDAEQFLKENEKWAGGNEYTTARSGKEFKMSPVYGDHGKISFDIDVIPIIHKR